jgi:NADH dehydrogenase
VTGDVTEPASYRSAIPPWASVINLAAATGKARPAELMAVNADATASLAAAATRAGTRHFVLVSSIAAGFADQRHYAYAWSKVRAEEAVRGSGAPYTVLRPTMVFGGGSPNLRSLTMLALAPVPALFGTGRTRIQPVHVDDLAGAVAAAAFGEPRLGDAIAYGGPETLTLDDLLARIRRARGRPARSPLHLPIPPLRALLALVEPVAFPVLPFTAGQLAAFVNDSVAPTGAALRGLPAATRSVDEMLADPPLPPRG